MNESTPQSLGFNLTSYLPKSISYQWCSQAGLNRCIKLRERYCRYEDPSNKTCQDPRSFCMSWKVCKANTQEANKEYSAKEQMLRRAAQQKNHRFSSWINKSRMGTRGVGMYGIGRGEITKSIHREYFENLSNSKPHELTSDCVDKLKLDDDVDVITDKDYIMLADCLEGKLLPESKPNKFTMMHLGLGVAGGAVLGFVLGKMIK